MPSQDKTYSFIAMWDMYGLECIYDLEPARAEIEAWEKESIFSMIKDETHRAMPEPIPIKQMILRAKVNSQRSYEIYEFNSSEPIDTVRYWFETTPQIIVEWIRKNGYKIYSDYSPTQSNQVIK